MNDEVYFGHADKHKQSFLQVDTIVFGVAQPDMPKALKITSLYIFAIFPEKHKG